ncbi:hypothetical protein CEXT_176361 [Caerostris extrusa]|uniref:Uncharacterized protein n=1 Tax=Caerostris extrusa TaxID=172846 RepID=A0AAV4MBX3_CAEEX|nr:hypothetical protein CEXT_176361 [Caerostris extrusa]
MQETVIRPARRHTDIFITAPKTGKKRAPIFENSFFPGIFSRAEVIGGGAKGLKIDRRGRRSERLQVIHVRGTHCSPGQCAYPVTLLSGAIDIRSDLGATPGPLTSWQKGNR